MRAIIDGVESGADEAVVSVFDWGLQRGYGAFEVIRSHRGKLFREEGHLDRLERSLAALHIASPPRPKVEDWARRMAAIGGDAAVRVIVTAGGRDPLFSAPSRTIVTWEPIPPVPDPFRLLPTTAWWHPGTDRGDLHGVKWLSYAPNMAASDAAHRDGFGDALLLTPAGEVLEGPTFTVAWLRREVVETPGLEMGILDSITRRVLFETASRLGLEVAEGRYTLERVLGADEVVALSTTKEVVPVAAVGEHPVPGGPVAEALADAHRAIVAEELA